jgi:CubicO group peptidase (beta-lactamase class C family)
MLSPTRPEPVTGTTLFEIGSVTKMFTSALLASAVEQGLVQLNDRLCDLLPEFPHLPPAMTLLRLATHTSGLPRLPGNFWPFILRQPRNPYKAYTPAHLLAYLARYESKRRQRPAWRAGFCYSNLGYGLLGYILAQRLGLSYEDAVVSRLCAPLGMPDTRITLSPAQRERLATPHSPGGKPTLNWDIPALAGAGALRSTAGDLLKFVAANLGQAPTGLAKVLSACHTVYVKLPPPPRGIRSLMRGWYRRRLIGNIELPFGVALGWHLSRLGTSPYRVYWHNGGTGGYHTFTGFVKDSGTGVVVLANRGRGMYDVLFRAPAVEEIGFSLLKLLNGVPDQNRDLARV